MISLPTANISFGQLSINQQADTVDNNPPPLVIQNDGNCYIDINITAAYLWQSNQSPSRYFQYRIDNTTETNAFNWTGSATTWTYFNSSVNYTSIKQLNYSDSSDSAQVELNITVPPNEATGKKNSTILFTGYYVRMP